MQTPAGRCLLPSSAREPAIAEAETHWLACLWPWLTVYPAVSACVPAHLFHSSSSSTDRKSCEVCLRFFEQGFLHWYILSHSLGVWLDVSERPRPATRLRLRTESNPRSSAEGARLGRRNHLLDDCNCRPCSEESASLSGRPFLACAFLARPAGLSWLLEPLPPYSCKSLCRELVSCFVVKLPVPGLFPVPVQGPIGEVVGLSFSSCRFALTSDLEPEIKSFPQPLIPSRFLSPQTSFLLYVFQD